MNPVCFSPRRLRLQGFSLIEMLVALAVGLIVILVVGRLFTMNTTSNHETASLARMQENARFALDLLGNDIRSAGDIGCNHMLTPTLDSGLSSASPYGYRNFNRTLTGVNPIDDSVKAYTISGSSSTVPDGLAVAEVEVGNDVLSIKRGDTGNKSALSVAQTSAGTITVDSANVAGFQTGDLLLIQNCAQADIFQAGTVTGGVITVAGSPNTFANSLLYAQYSEVMRFVNDIYYIGTGTGASSGQSCPLYAFCRKSLIAGTPTTEVLANNVEQFHVYLGLLVLSTHGYIDAYETASSLASTDWCRVGGVQVNLVFRGDDNVTSTANTPYWLNNAQVTPTTGDHRLRRGYSEVFYTFPNEKVLNNCT